MSFCSDLTAMSGIVTVRSQIKDSTQRRSANQFAKRKGKDAKGDYRKGRCANKVCRRQESNKKGVHLNAPTKRVQRVIGYSDLFLPRRRLMRRLIGSSRM